MARATKTNNWGNAYGFLSDMVPGNVMTETPNGVVDGGSIRHQFSHDTPPQEHEGAVNPPARTGSRGGTAGSKPVIKAGF